MFRKTVSMVLTDVLTKLFLSIIKCDHNQKISKFQKTLNIILFTRYYTLLIIDFKWYFKISEITMFSLNN